MGACGASDTAPRSAATTSGEDTADDGQRPPTARSAAPVFIRDPGAPWTWIPDQWLKSVQQLQQEAQAQQDVAAVLAAETQQAQTAKLRAEAVRAEAETAEIGERLKIDRARAVKELEEPAREAGGAAAAR
jgi:hypothetical protein